MNETEKKPLSEIVIVPMKPEDYDDVRALWMTIRGFGIRARDDRECSCANSCEAVLEALDALAHNDGTLAKLLIRFGEEDA